MNSASLNGDLRQDLSLGIAEGQDLVVEARHGDVAVAIFQRGQHLAQRLNGIVDGAAVLAGVQIARRAGDFHLNVAQAAQRIDQAGQIGAQHVRVADHGHVGLELLAVRFDERIEAGPADLFFALDEQFHIDGQPAAGLQERLQAPWRK